jgi:putative ABC transport system permease protein
MRAFSPRWRKVRRDLTHNKLRTLLVALCIGVGVSVVGMIAGARDLIIGSLAANAARISLPSATLSIDSFDADMLAQLRDLPGVALVEGRRHLVVRVRTSAGAWRDMQLVAIPSYDRMALNRVFPQAGAWPPSREQLLLERSAVSYLGTAIGQSLPVELPNSSIVQLRIAGTAYDLSHPPAASLGLPLGYITMDTLAWLGQPPSLNELYLTTTNPSDWDQAKAVAARVRDTIERQGPHVLSISVPKPGRFWAMNAADSLLLLLGALGVLSVVMSAFLVINTASALLTQQTRQIGIMKSLGAEDHHLVRMYLVLILVFGLIALAVGIPLGGLGASALLAMITRSMNFDPLPFRIAPATLGLQLVAGLVLPALAALVPIRGGSRITILEAINNRASAMVREGGLERLLRRLRVSRPFALSLRNTLRKKSRLALTLGALSLASAIFIGVLGVRASILRTNQDAFLYANYNVELDFVQSYPAAAIRQQALAVPGVDRVQAWQTVSAYPLRRNGSKGDTLQVLGIDPSSDFIQPSLVAGRWLRPQDRNGVVVDSKVIDAEPGIQVGDAVTLQIGKIDTSWQVVGIVKGFNTAGQAYVNLPDLGSALGTFGQANRLTVLSLDQSLPGQLAVHRALEQRFERANMQLGSTLLSQQLRASVQASWDVLVGALMLMALLLGLGGGLGLMATMGISVVERTREIGVMRAIGASDGAIMRIVLGEGLLTGFAGWLVGTILSVPLSGLLSRAVGYTFLNAPLSYVYSGGGAVIWLFMMLAMAAVASWFPARRAAKLTVRDVLAYEG